MNRREFFESGGALIVGFSLFPSLAAAKKPPEAQNVGKAPLEGGKLPGDLEKAPMLDSWIRVGVDGRVTVLTGKAELGQGIMTALLQIAAEQLEVDLARITLVTADTARTPNEGYTAGSHSMQDSGTAILNAAAQVRAILVDRAAKRLGVPPARLKARNGEIAADDGRRVGYGELVGDEVLHVRAKPRSPLEPPSAHTVMGKPVPRVDIPGKVTGAPAYVQDLRLPGMVHGRVVRPPSYAAKLKAVDEAAASRLPGVLKVVRDGDFLAVVADGEYRAVQAMRALAGSAQWELSAKLPPQGELYGYLQELPSQDLLIHRQGAASAAGATLAGAMRVVQAEYHRPYQMHASIGPSCAVAQLENGLLTVWTHSQGVYPLRSAIAEMLGMAQEKVRCIHVQGSGCYGHNGADDAAADAALLARALPGRPVRVQWMREDANAWEPYGPAMVSKARAALDAQGRIVSWEYEVWSNTHSTRPGPAGNLLPARLLAKPFAPPAPKPLPMPEGGGDRNAVPIYRLPSARVTYHFVPEMPLRVSALRALGAYLNVFSIESFMDELAAAARVDAVEFRLRHLDDPRAQDVVRAAAKRFDWAGYRRRRDRGRGFAFARYKNLAAYMAVALEVELERETGRLRVVRAAAAVDSGEAVNPDGIRNQIEGGIVQSTSWTTFEAVNFDRREITSTDWSRYPILRFADVPGKIDVEVIDRPGEPFLGTGEAAQGPTSAALANALADASGARFRDLPLDRARLRKALRA